MAPGQPAVMPTLSDQKVWTDSDLFFKVTDGLATIVLVPSGTSHAGRALSVLLSVLRSCALRAEVSTVFFWVDWKATFEFDESSLGALQEEENLVETLVKEIAALPQVVVGFAGGHVCNIGTCLLSVCDHVVVSSGTELELLSRTFPLGSMALPMCLLRRLGLPIVEHVLASNGPVSAARALELGLVQEVLGGEGSAALVHRQEELSYPPQPGSPCLTKRLACDGNGKPSPIAAGKNVSAEDDNSPRQSSDTVSPEEAGISSVFEESESSTSSSEGGELAVAEQVAALLESMQEPETASQTGCASVPNTALVIRGIPSCTTQTQLLTLINSTGFTGKFDFFRLEFGEPVSQAFINFPCTHDRALFVQRFQSIALPGSQPQMYCCEVRPLCAAGSVQCAWPWAPPGLSEPLPAPSRMGEGCSIGLDKLEGVQQMAGQGHAQEHQDHHDLSALFRPITALMICNLPCSVTQQRLGKAVDSIGFLGKYDFLYLPTKRRQYQGGPKNRLSNLGYAFINFPCPEDATRFCQAFAGYRFQGTLSNKVCAVRPAHVQGASCNIRSTMPFMASPSTARSQGSGLAAMVRREKACDEVHIAEF